MESIKHVAKMEVDEDGAVAAAATAILIRKCKPEVVVLDAPFLFTICNKRTGLVLFMARVVDPVAA